MRTFSKSAWLVLLVALAGGVTSLAQTNPPAALGTNKSSALVTFTSRNPVSSKDTITNTPKPATTRVTSRRYSGKILSVDTNARVITLQGGEKAGIGIPADTKIVKDKQPATIVALAVGQSVSGMERRDRAGNWLADTLNVGDARQPAWEEEPTVIPVAADKKDEATANIHIMVPGGNSAEEYSFGSLPVQQGIVRTNILTSVFADSVPGADLVRSIHVDGAAVVPWYSNVADMDIICHVTPGKHEITVLLKDNNTGQTSDQPVGPLTLTLKTGETQIADFR
jgi:hypothetical protein